MEVVLQQLKDGQHLHRNSQVALDTARNGFTSSQFKTRMSAQVNCFLYLNALLFPE